MTHSPAPWRIVRSSEYTGDPEDTMITEIVAADGRVVLFTDCGYFKPLEADACLIEAAPKLLEALQQIMAHVAGCQKEPRYEAARAAIAEATGTKL